MWNWYLPSDVRVKIKEDFWLKTKMVETEVTISFSWHLHHQQSIIDCQSFHCHHQHHENHQHQYDDQHYHEGFGVRRYFHGGATDWTQVPQFQHQLICWWTICWCWCWSWRADDDDDDNCLIEEEGWGWLSDEVHIAILHGARRQVKRTNYIHAIQ